AKRPSRLSLFVFGRRPLRRQRRRFVNPEGSPLLQSMVMASVHFMIAMVWQCSLAGALNSAKNLLKNASFMKWMEGVTGMVLVGLGVKLLIEEPA
ncbi:LysE family transporter, partial [Vibrio lentus]